MRQLISFCVFVFFSAAGFAQVGQPSTNSEGSPKSRFAVRFDRFSGIGLPYKGEMSPHVRDCVLVLSDGRYKFEHWDERPIVDKRIVMENERYTFRVVVGRLSEDQYSQLGKIVNSPEFRKIKTAEPLRQSLEFFEATVMREGEPNQKFTLSESTDYKPNRGVLKSVFKWMQKRDELRTTFREPIQPTKCLPPIDLPNTK